MAPLIVLLLLLVTAALLARGGTAAERSCRRCGEALAIGQLDCPCGPHH